MQQTYISFYLRSNNILIFKNALREIGEPNRICIMISDDGEKMLIKPYDKRDFKSHRVPKDAYSGTGRMSVTSKKLCRIIAKEYNWDINKSYRVPGNVIEEQKVAIFYLKKASEIVKTRENIDENKYV